MQHIIQTDRAPAPIGAYSQAVGFANWIFLSGQIGISPNTTELVSEHCKVQCEQIFKNMSAICQAAGGDIKHIVKLTVFLTDLSDMPIVNESITHFFGSNYPARSSVQVSALPKGAKIEVEGILILPA